MAYTQFDNGKPLATQTGPQFADSSRQNLQALRDALIASDGQLYGWSFAATGGTPEQPTTLTYSSGTERVKAVLTWGTTGGEAGNVTAVAWSYSADSGGAYDTIGTRTVTYDSNGNVTAASWS